MTRISYSLGSFPTTSTTSAQLAPLHVNEQKVLFLRRQQRLVSEHLKEPVYTAVRTQRDLLVLGQVDKQPVPQPTLGDKQLFLWSFREIQLRKMSCFLVDSYLLKKMASVIKLCEVTHWLTDFLF